MRSFSRRLIYTLSNKILSKNSQNALEEKLTADFSKIKKSLFNIKSESTYNSYLSNGSLALELKKTNCIAWIEIPEIEFDDHVIEAQIRLDSLGGYASTGIIFRITDEETYYMALVSSKGYFRLDAVKDNAPKTLIAWTDLSDFSSANFRLSIVTYGTYLIFLVDGKWIGEISDDSISGSGRVGFVLASYENEDAPEADASEDVSETDESAANADECTCKACLDYFSVDTRIKTIEEKFKKWTDDANINAEGRLRLAETFAVMGKSLKSLEQIKRAWKRRDEAISSISVSYTEVRTKKELLLAARMLFDLGQYDEAEEHIDALLEQWANSTEGKSAHEEKIKILNELNKFAELKEFAVKHSSVLEKDVNYYTMLGRCYWELKEYKKSAEAWKKAFAMNGENGVYAANAANALELSKKPEEALALFLEAGKIFLNQDNQPELAAMMPKLSSLGEKNWEARTLAGKWAFSTEDYIRCAAEFAAAEKLRRVIKPRQKADPALYYLWGLVLNIKGKNKDAIKFLERAVKLAPDYGLFRFKLAEIKLAGGVKDFNLAKELKIAVELSGNDSEMANYAGNLLLRAGDEKGANYFFGMVKN